MKIAIKSYCVDSCPVEYDLCKIEHGDKEEIDSVVHVEMDNFDFKAYKKAKEEWEDWQRKLGDLMQAREKELRN